jgi:hypothetical protein
MRRKRLNFELSSAELLAESSRVNRNLSWTTGATVSEKAEPLYLLLIGHSALELPAGSCRSSKETALGTSVAPEKVAKVISELGRKCLEAHFASAVEFEQNAT